MNLYVVMGHTGTYDGHTSWPVMAFSTEEAAKAHAEKAEKCAEEIAEWEDAQGFRWAYSPDPSKPVNEFDANMALDIDSGTYYRVMVVPVAEPK